MTLGIDLDIDVENLPPPEVKFDPERGVKIVTQYYGDENGNLIREIKESKIEKRLVASQIAERKKWQKYGDAKNDPPGGNSANTYPGDVVTMQLVQTRQPEQDQERQDLEEVRAKARVQSAMCRYCKGSHFSHKCPNKSDMEAMQALREKLKGQTDAVDEGAEKPAEPVVSTGRYLPPQLRGAAGVSSILGGSAGGSGEKRQMDGHTIRVTNLPSETTADDLKRIFSPFGRVTRMFPAKDKHTQQNRGFAFISYEKLEEAAAAIYGVNGLRHNHVVLKVDWAKPSAN
ncbi:Eukaryotic translation initiation factor 3 subunit G [Fasciolopsis buskii]|uniref:Eukaryotic translation initiation factor 3 subunit G n=1 Tax=Fasciolopsis buskii TaxID=27845 RepID=A0A8E0VMN3_9TREM|nr:Eukaryotic translation initiation factor 3 subunit G [Fasciolopsis buski]